MTYCEFPPPPSLKSTARCVWTFSADFGREHHDERIAPDGFPELIFHFGTPYREQDSAGRWRAQPNALLAGNLTAPLLLRSTGCVGVLGIRLWPHGVGRFMDAPVEETLNARMALGGGQRSRIGAILRKLNGVSGKDALCVAAVDLVELLSRKEFHEDTTVNATVRDIVTARGQGQVEHWAQAAGLSQRQLERRMVAATGMSPKLFASIIRFRAVFDELQAGKPSAWLKAAVDSGYFDQAHMVRAFNRFAGQPPREYLRSAGLLSSALVQSAGK